MNKEQLFDVVVATIQTNRNSVIAMIRKNGIPLNQNATDDQIFTAFVSLVNTSDKFRQEFANLVQSTASKVQSKVGTMNANGANFGKELSSGSAEKSGGVWDYLGRVFTPEVTSNLVNNLFGLFGGQTPQQGATNLGQANTRFQTQEPAPKGLSTGAIIGISVGVIALIGLTIYLVRK